VNTIRSKQKQEMKGKESLKELNGKELGVSEKNVFQYCRKK